jgi:hypothetical protein
LGGGSRARPAQGRAFGGRRRAGESALTQTRYEFGEAELSVYGEYELQVLERVLREDREEAMVDVAQAICAKIGWNSGRGDERAFLEAYYTQCAPAWNGACGLAGARPTSFPEPAYSPVKIATSARPV